MQYTQQQLTGQRGYGYKTFIGNYSESLQLEEDRLRENIRQRGQGSSIVGKLRRHLQTSTLTPQHADENLWFGDQIMLQNAVTQGCLSADLDDVLGPGKYGVSTTVGQTPVLRSVFTIERIPAKEDRFYEQRGEAHVVHYGQRFLLVSEHLHPDHKLYLQSLPVTPQCQSRVSKKQEVALVAEAPKLDLTWQVIAADIRRRPIAEGQPVKVNSVVVLGHSGTGQFLASDKKPIKNSFGGEYEVCCHRYVGQQTKHTSNQETEEVNLWAFVSAPTDAQFREYKDAAFGDTPSIVEKVKQKILERAGTGGYRAVVRVLGILDGNSDQKLRREEVKEGLMRYGLVLTDPEVDAVMRTFDRDGSGTISITEFLRTLRGEMNERRRNLVLLAYDRLDKSMDGVVTMDELAAIYAKNCTRHPDVETGRKTAKQVLLEFTSDWDKNGDSTVTKDEFIDYYTDLSVNIDLDDYFELMIRNAWHISGGSGWYENTTCRRVLVTHTDGRQTVEEIKDDLGITKDDIQLMRENLERQGIRVRDIKLYE